MNDPSASIIAIILGFSVILIVGSMLAAFHLFGGDIDEAPPPEPVLMEVSDTASPLDDYRTRYNAINPVMDDPINEADLLYRLYIIVDIQEEMALDDSIKHDDTYIRLWADMDSKINSIRHYFFQQYQAQLYAAQTPEDIEALKAKVKADLPYHVWPNEDALNRFYSQMEEKSW